MTKFIFIMLVAVANLGVGFATATVMGFGPTLQIHQGRFACKPGDVQGGSSETAGGNQRP